MQTKQYTTEKEELLMETLEVLYEHPSETRER